MKNSRDLYYAKVFEDCYTVNFHKISSFVTSYLHDWDLAKGIAQEVFVVLWENREKVDFSQNLLPYLFLIAKNKSINAIKKVGSKQRYIEYTNTHTRETLDIKALSHNSSTSIYSKEIQELAHIAIESLPQKVKLTFLEYKRNGITYSQLADQEGVSVKTIEYRISFALRELRKCLKDYLPFYLGYLIDVLF